MRRVCQASIVFVGLWSCALAGPAGAQEYCVACTEPNAVYRCVIDGAQPGGSQPLQMLCITAMAKQGSHGTCGIKRGTVFDCDGQVKRVPWSAINAPPPAPAAPAAPAKQSAVEPPQPAAPAGTKADPEEPPQTILEMAKRANEKTAEQMKKANDNMKEQAKSTGEAFAKASKKTWDCVSSFFTRCNASE